jgi:hypothetical protein
VFRRLLPFVAVLPLVLAACGGAGPTPTPELDARAIITKGMAATGQLKSFHLELTANGKVNVPELGSNGLNLKGSTLDGDIDIVGKKAAIHFAVPPLLGLEGDVVVIDGTSYVKTTLTGEKWMKASADGGASPSAVPDPKQTIDDIAAFLDKDGVEAKKLDDAACGDRSCYQVELTIPTALIEDAAASAGPMASAAPSGEVSQILGDQLVVDLAFDREKLYLSSATTSIDSKESGSLTLELALSKFDESTSISAPPADQVDESGSGFSFP